MSLARDWNGRLPWNSIKSCAAFSLVEVVLALGIVAFALIGMLALLPAGMKSTRDSLEQDGAINILSHLIADRKATPYGSPSQSYSLPPLTSSTASSSNTFGVNAANGATTDLQTAAYRVTYEVTPSTDPYTPYQIYFKVSWPAGPTSDHALGYVDTMATFSQP